MADYTLAPINEVNPRRRLHDVGMSREAVGGGRVQIGQGAPGMPVPRARGFTRPVVVTNNSFELFPVDYDRRFLFIQNNDALGIVFVSFGGDSAQLNQGFRLGVNGGAILLDINAPTERVFVVGTIANNPNVTAITG